MRESMPAHALECNLNTFEEAKIENPLSFKEVGIHGTLPAYSSNNQLVSITLNNFIMLVLYFRKDN